MSFKLSDGTETLLILAEIIEAEEDPDSK